MLLPDIEGVAERLGQSMAAEGSTWVSGPVGSGRSMLLRRLSAADPGVTVIELPLLTEPDVGAVLALLALSALPAERRALLAEAPMSAIAEALAEVGARVVVRVPSASSREAADHVARSTVSDLGWLGRVPGTVWLADSGVEPSTFGLKPARMVALPMHRAAFDPQQPWGSYADAARELAAHVPGFLKASPLKWRLAVGAIGLGVSVTQVVNRCAAQTEGYLSLVELVAKRLGERPEIDRAVARFDLARRPIPRRVVEEVAAPPAEHAALLIHCLGYGEPVRFPSMLRRHLRQAREGVTDREAAGLGDAHAALADYQRGLDGVADPTSLESWQTMEAWTEKVHHLAWGGAATADEWSAQRLPRRELYWDRARWLSRVERDYAEASRVYRAGLARFPKDDYALHYEAWNRERAGEPPRTVVAGYAAAVEQAPDNVWWNARYIAALIRAGEPVEARRAWGAALHCIDPDGEALARDPWLAIHLYYWVAEAWEASGAWATARAILRSIPGRFDAELAEVRRGFGALVARIRAKASEEWLRFDEWLAAQVGERWVEVAKTMHFVKASATGIAPPMVEEGEDGPSLTWSRPGVLVQVEVVGPDRVEWFAHDRVSDRMVGSDAAVSLSDGALVYWLQRARDE